ncbi:unnamed protein product [Rhizoctonia solani]|uniref:Uncharacterized protein n=1 Tax=Rhizoctonia solani TaxID=456999 RepID=A0A8H3E1D3_9AGAM|nr:unnamed protein product [Rhizoctonia solani]
MTCKRNYNLVKNSACLQLQIELEANGLEIAGLVSKNASYQQILEELIRYRNAWLDLDILPPVSRPMKEDNMKCWQSYEGHWLLGFSDSDTEDNSKPDSLQTINLDSSTLPPAVNFQTEYDQFTVDPSQQLAVLLSENQEELRILHIHLRSSVTGQPHPLARRPTLTATLPEGFEAHLSRGLKRLRFGPQIVGSTLVVNVGSPQEWTFCVLVWDWMAGVLLGHIPCRDAFCDIGFLDNRHLIAYTAYHHEPDSDNESDSDDESHSPSESGERERVLHIQLSLYTIPYVKSYHNADPTGQYDVFCSDTLCPRVFFNFPSLRDGFDIVPHRSLLWLNSPPGCITHTSRSAQFARPKVPTLALTLTLTKRGYFGTSFHTEGAHIADIYYRIFVDTRCLLKHVPVGERQKTVRWNEWGEQATRWFQEDPEFIDYRMCWVGWASGSRFVKGNTVDDAQALSLFDFDPLTVERHVQRSHPDYIPLIRTPSEAAKDTKAVRRGKGLFVPRLSYGTNFDGAPSLQPSNEVFVDFVRRDQPTIVYEGFQESIRSRLPYRVVTKLSPVLPSGGWFIDGGRIFAIHQWSDAPWEFHVFKLNIGDDVTDLSGD